MSIGFGNSSSKTYVTNTENNQQYTSTVDNTNAGSFGDNSGVAVVGDGNSVTYSDFGAIQAAADLTRSGNKMTSENFGKTVDLVNESLASVLGFANDSTNSANRSQLDLSASFENALGEVNEAYATAETGGVDINKIMTYGIGGITLAFLALSFMGKK